MKSHVLIFALSIVLYSFSAQPAATAQETALTTIAFGSCARQDEPQPIWDRIIELDPDAFLFIGDNIYADTEDMNVMRDKYARLGAKPGFRRLRAATTLLATWDDHDYGVNDGGAEYPRRAESQQIFLDFFGEPEESPRRERNGVYDARIFGPPGKRVQIILLDTRYFRSPLTRAGFGDDRSGPYVLDPDPAKTMLGEAQWQWLSRQLLEPAELRLIVSSIQVVAEDHRWEKWINLPHERQRLFETIRNSGAEGVLFLSGDRHLAELSVIDGGVGYPLYDLTSSGLNSAARDWRPHETNRHRVGTMNRGDNFGLVSIDWQRPDPLIRLQIRDIDGDITIQRKIPLSLLQPGTINSATLASDG